jgi:hypothetical protein
MDASSKERRAKVVIDYRSTGCWVLGGSSRADATVLPGSIENSETFCVCTGFSLFGWTMGI